MGKDGTQLLRHCVRILVLVSTDLLAVRLSGIFFSHFWFRSRSAYIPPCMYICCLCIFMI